MMLRSTPEFYVAAWHIAKIAGRFDSYDAKPYLNTCFSQAIDFACNFANFGVTWHYTSENRIFEPYIGVSVAFATRFE